MDPKWEPKGLVVSSPSTPKSTPLTLPSPSLMSRIFNSWNNSPQKTSPLKNEGLQLKMEENISDINLDLLNSNDTLNDLVEEFDPIAKDDWMLSFESPAKSTLKTTSYKATTPIKSLIDDLIPIATPNSIVKFTQRDLDLLKLDLETREFEVAQLEIQEMESQRKLYLGLNKKLESQVSSLLNSKSEGEKFSRLADQLSSQRDSLLQENELLQVKCKKLNLQLEEAKSQSFKVLESQQGNLEKIQILENRYETLKSHAESKLDEANVEIAKTRSNYEKEISALKTKLQRSELTISSLERSLASKVEENKELTVICDGLVQQMENLAT